MKKERWSDGGSGEAATAACEGAGGRRMSQCEWVGVRVMKWNGEWGRGQAWSSCLGSLQGTRAPIATGKKQKPPKPWFYTKWESRKLMVNGSRLSPASCTSGSFTVPVLSLKCFSQEMQSPPAGCTACWAQLCEATLAPGEPWSRRGW